MSTETDDVLTDGVPSFAPRSPALLRRALRALAALASEAHGEATKQIHETIHAEIRAGLLTLTASDGHRACAVSLPGRGALEGAWSLTFPADPAHPVLQGQPFFTELRLAPQPVFARIFLTDDGAPQLDYSIPMLNELAYPIERVRQHQAEAERAAGRAARGILVNPAYLADGLVIVNSLWSVLERTPPEVTLVSPDTASTAVALKSKTQDFSVFYCVMPYFPKPS